jgi:hypothetical protein
MEVTYAPPVNRPTVHLTIRGLRMTCYQIPEDDTVTVRLCTSGPSREVKRESAGVKWCFSDRAHLPHDFVIFDSVEPGYYGPSCRYDCSQCHQDHTVGFGMSRKWDWD